MTFIMAFGWSALRTCRCYSMTSFLLTAQQNSWQVQLFRMSLVEAAFALALVLTFPFWISMHLRTKIASIDLDVPMILCLESAHNALAIGYRDNVMLLHLGSLDPLAKSDLEPMEGGEDSDSNSDLPPPKRVS